MPSPAAAPAAVVPAAARHGSRAVPVGWLEAVPDVRAQEGAVQGQGMLCSAQAAPAGLQPGRGHAGGCRGCAVSQAVSRSFLGSEGTRSHEIARVLRTLGVCMRLIGVVRGWVRCDLMRKSRSQGHLGGWGFVGKTGLFAKAKASRALLGYAFQLYYLRFTLNSPHLAI